MKLKDLEAHVSSIPVFATTTAAAAYKVGNQQYIDLLFLRSHFIVDQDDEPTEIEGNASPLNQQKAELIFSKVAAVTISADQANDLIASIQYQLKELAKK